MKLSTFMRLVASGQLSFILKMGGNFRQSYRSSFIAAALSEGVYSILREGPATLDHLYECLIGVQPANTSSGEGTAKNKLKTWLDLGVSLGELKLTPAGYALHGKLSRQLAKPSNDAWAAMFQEVCTLHHDLIVQTPARLRENRPFQFDDTNGQLIARSSRILEPYIFEVVDSVVPEKGAYRLFEVGCGSGVYIQRACQRNPQLYAMGLELQPEVADFARQNMRLWGLSERVRVDTRDIRTYDSPECFDLVTLHNNIYYFPVQERLSIIQRLANFLTPGGKIVMTTGCQGSQSTQLLNLWGEMTEGAGPLPEVDAVCDLLSQAGFHSLKKIVLLPGGSFYSFTGIKS